jgi:hypothetical protein
MGLSLATATACLAGCDDSRSKAMQREVESVVGDAPEKEALPERGPPHELRAQLEPVLSKIYALNKVPHIVEADIDIASEYNYEVEAGVAAVVRFRSGLSKAEQVKAVVMGVAEADAWAFRPNARREYADLVHRVKRGYGDDQKDAILKEYAHLRLLQFFNSDDAGAAIAALPEDLKGPVQQMSQHYVSNKEQVWKDWMAVKMYARRVVAGDEPFRGVLREIKKELGHEEPPPRTWAESNPAPFDQWAARLVENEKLMRVITDMRELKDREAFLNDTHQLFVVEGSQLVPPKAKKVRVDPSMGFGVLREDLGGGYNDLTFVFSRKLGGSSLKKAWLRAVIYAHLLHDFQMLSAAGGDWAERDENNRIDPKTAVVPDAYDPLYAKCGSAAAVDTLIAYYRDNYAFLADMQGSKDEDRIHAIAHTCVISGADGKVHVPPKGDKTDVEGPAPGSYLALRQMMARFTDMDLTVAKMADERPTAEDELIDEQEKLLKELENAQKGDEGTK